MPGRICKEVESKPRGCGITEESGRQSVKVRGAKRLLNREGKLQLNFTRQAPQ